MSLYIEQARYTCALGAQQTVLAIPGALPVVHAGPGCSGKVSGFTTTGSGHQGEEYAGGSHIPCTNTYEQEVVFGGEKKLRHTIDGALQVMKGDLFVIMTGCTADIVGDDSVNIAKEYAARGYPVVGVETAGFKGNNYFGHELVVNAIIEQFTGSAGARPRKGLVNLFSVAPFQNPYWRGDIEALKALLESIGLEVNSLFGYSSAGVSEWKDIPNAQFNLLVSPWVGLSTVKLLEKKYGTPFLHCPVLPVGAQETSAFLRNVGAFAGVAETLVERVIKKEESRFYRYLVSMVDFLAEYRNNLPSELYTVADSSYGIGTSGFLVNEIGYIPRGLYLIDGPAENYISFITATAASQDPKLGELLVFETDGGLVQRDIKKRLGKSRKALFLGSGWEKSLAQETNNLYTFLSLPLPEAVITSGTYVGYNGGLNLLSEIYSNVFRARTTTSRTQFIIDEAG
ncbi:MAG: hydrogenase [Treponema sp.]|jgi:nitrogenase molybdenum-iron protein beta chain|nr:hydrogenase [Treponema sp.]